jgi:hypothetical protein
MQIETVNLDKGYSLDSFYLSLQSLIGISKSFQRRCRDTNIFPHNYLEDVCSVSIKGPRGSGHTGSVLEYVIRNKLNSVFISNSRHEENRVIEEFKSKLQKRGLDFSTENPFTILSKNGDVYTVEFNSISSECLMGINHNPQAIIIDNYSSIKNRGSLLKKLDIIRTRAQSCSQHLKGDFFFITLN